MGPVQFMIAWLEAGFKPQKNPPEPVITENATVIVLQRTLTLEASELRKSLDNGILF